MSIIAELVSDLVQEHYNYLSACEKRSTAQYKEIASLTAKTKELQANIELAEKYFQNKMKERQRLFQSASKELDVAIKNGDIESAEIAVRTLAVVHSQSPFSFD